MLALIKRTSPLLGDTLATICAWCLFVFLLIGIAALGGCTNLPYGGTVISQVQGAVQTAEKDRAQFNDDKASLLTKLPCDMSVGAFFRLGNRDQQQAIVLMCGGQQQALPMVPAPSPLSLNSPGTQAKGRHLITAENNPGTQAKGRHQNAGAEVPLPAPS